MKTIEKYGPMVWGDLSGNHLCKETKGTPQIESLEECDISVQNNVSCEIVT